jgi:hypothetical protein
MAPISGTNALGRFGNAISDSADHAITAVRSRICASSVIVRGSSPTADR